MTTLTAFIAGHKYIYMVDYAVYDWGKKFKCRQR
jgi:hypothetical protein